MRARTKARRRALEILFEADVRGRSISEAYDDAARRADAHRERLAEWGYVTRLVTGVVERQAEIDELIETYAHGWTLNRMPALDRAIIRIGVWELMHNTEVPTTAAIAEAVEAATLLSTDDSPGFVNGLLARIAQLAPARDSGAVDSE
ncbi:transcription antitermination factor NusB [Ruicaihuangia caeni]|uniref:transcription antitermination factor NusB n=1 Tax=Ruicaihuangia caeni TaxID=3042517 RepID=UPI00338D35C3